MYERMAPAMEAKGSGAHRHEALVGLSGRVIEVGAGTGLNFAHYPDTVTEVIAVDVSRSLAVLRGASGFEAMAIVPVPSGDDASPRCGSDHRQEEFVLHMWRPSPAGDEQARTQ